MDIRKEKKIILYTILFFIMFIYISMYAINYIVDKSMVSGGTTVEVNTGKNNTIDNNNNVINYNNVDNNNQVNNNSTNNTVSNTTKPEGDNKSKDDNKPQNDAKPQDDNKPQEDDNPTDPTDPGEEIIVDNSDVFKVYQNEKEWKDLKQIDVFKNKYFNDQAIIAPGVNGKYNFIVSSEDAAKFKYNIVFTDENNYNINLKYKLLRNGKYISGNTNEWVNVEELNTSEMLLNPNTRDIFTIEWEWIDAKNDTEVGQTVGADYKMNIEVKAIQVD